MWLDWNTSVFVNMLNKMICKQLLEESYKNERELQRTLIGNISDFILELGTGFSFVAEKYKLRT